LSHKRHKGSPQKAHKEDLSLLMKTQNNSRSADVRRKTKETDVRVRLNLDGSGRAGISIGHLPTSVPESFKS